MGVKGLQYFIENKCPDACKKVSIHHLANEHRMIHNCDPVIVVDGMALINRLYAKNFEWIYGGQWIQFVKKLEEFIALFRDFGIRLVFFFDGTVCAAKRKEWVKRRIDKYRQIKAIFSDVRVNFMEPDQKLFQLPTSMGTLTRFALKELGVEVYQTDREADEVIAEYANNNRNVFAILSQDSDFIIYNTKTYLSLQHLALESLTTIHYDRDCFALQYLHLNVNQLPLFACLAGNDIIPIHKLNYFHRSISSKKYGRIYINDIAESLAIIIKKERWSANVNDKNNLHLISRRICGNSSLVQLLNTGLSSYTIGINTPLIKINIYLQPKTESEVLVNHLQCVNAPFVYNLLCNLEYESSEVLEDDAHRLPSALVYRRIRQKCYGVLFNYSQSPAITKDGKPVLVKEWCAYHGNSMENPEYIQPLPINLPHRLRYTPFSVERLWFQCSYEEKMIVLHSILELSFQFDTFLKLPKQFIVLSSVLNCLINGMNSGILLEPLDIAALMIQALFVSDSNVNGLEPCYYINKVRVDETAVNISTLFMRGVTTILMAINICGNPFPVSFAMPWQFFDGKLFHYNRIKLKEQPFIGNICNQRMLNQFYWLLSIVTTNTPFHIQNFRWANILKDFDVYYAYQSI